MDFVKTLSNPFNWSFARSSPPAQTTNTLRPQYNATASNASSTRPVQEEAPMPRIPKLYGKPTRVLEFLDSHDVIEDPDEDPASVSARRLASTGGKSVKRAADSESLTIGSQTNKRAKTGDRKEEARLLGHSLGYDLSQTSPTAAETYSRNDSDSEDPIPINTTERKKKLNGQAFGGLQPITRSNQTRPRPGRPGSLHSSLSQQKPSRGIQVLQEFSSRLSRAAADPEVIENSRLSKRRRKDANDMSREAPIEIEDDEISMPSLTPVRRDSSDTIGHSISTRSKPTTTQEVQKSISTPKEFGNVEIMMNHRNGTQARTAAGKQTVNGHASSDDSVEGFTKMAKEHRLREQQEGGSARDRKQSRESTSPIGRSSQNTRSTFVTTEGHRRDSSMDSPDVLHGKATVGIATSSKSNQGLRRRKSQDQVDHDPSHLGDNIKQPYSKGPVLEDFFYAGISIPPNNDFMVTLEKNKIAVRNIGMRLGTDPISTFPFSSISKLDHGHRIILLHFRPVTTQPASEAAFALHTLRETSSFIRNFKNAAHYVKVISYTAEWDEGVFSQLRKRYEKAVLLATSREGEGNTLAEAHHSTNRKPQVDPRRKEQRALRELPPDQAPSTKGADLNIPLSTLAERVSIRAPATESTPDANASILRDSTSANKDPVKSEVKHGRRASRRITRDQSSIVKDDPWGGHQELIPSPVPFSKTGQLGHPWKKSLVYPETGKKRADVEFRDLERLDENEYLNDNLINFFLRFLEHHLQEHQPELAKKVYFFNTFFYATLTNERAKKGINYDGVQKWTRAVDIFTHDFVVVPINENAHWYVAIICNLSKLLSGPEKVEEAELATNEQNIEASPEGSSSPKNVTHTFERIDEPSEELRHPVSEEQHIASEKDIEETDRSLQDLVLEDRPQVTSDINEAGSLKAAWKATKSVGDTLRETFQGLGTQALGKRTPKSKKSARKSGAGLQKYDEKAPIIITMDSLGIARSPTTRILKEYLIEEARAKLNTEIDGSRIRGMTAKGIPSQTNYSDCGLFLLAYMEKFILNPYHFVGAILHREMDEYKDWPIMESSDLRNRLRSLIMDLHKAQGKGEKMSVDIGKVLLGKARRQTPPLDLDPSPEPQPKSPNISKYFAEPTTGKAKSDSTPAKPEQEIQDGRIFFAEQQDESKSAEPVDESDTIVVSPNRTPAIIIESDASQTSPLQARTTQDTPGLAIENDIVDDFEDMFNPSSKKKETAKPHPIVDDDCIEIASEQADLVDDKSLGDEVAETPQTQQLDPETAEDSFDELQAPAEYIRDQVKTR